MLTNALSDRLAARLPFYYGYVMIPIAMMIQICTCPGQTFAISAFTPRIRESLELSDSRLSLAYMLGTVLAALPLSLMGPLSDRMGLRLLTVVAVLSHVLRRNVLSGRGRLVGNTAQDAQDWPVSESHAHVS